MLKLLCISLLLCAGLTSRASFVPAEEKQSAPGQSFKPVTLEEFEATTGKKLNWAERIQFKKAQRMMAKGKMSPFWNAEEITEGFQFLPFIGSFLTLGIVYIVMFFTAKDANALRWARWGAFAIWVVWLTAAIVMMASGSYSY